MSYWRDVAAFYTGVAVFWKGVWCWWRDRVAPVWRGVRRWLMGEPVPRGFTPVGPRRYPRKPCPRCGVEHAWLRRVPRPWRHHCAQRLPFTQDERTP